MDLISQPTLSDSQYAVLKRTTKPQALDIFLIQLQEKQETTQIDSYSFLLKREIFLMELQEKEFDLLVNRA